MEQEIVSYQSEDNLVVVESDVKGRSQSPVENIETMIIEVRGQQVMLDRDLARLYGVKTSRLNEQVKRNIARFPQSFRFQLTESERDEVVAKCDNLRSLKFNPSLPYVFTEQGIAQLSTVLHSQTAIQVSVRIMEAFVAMRRFLLSNAALFQRVEHLEMHIMEHDKQIANVFQRINHQFPPRQGIFFDGQVFDAHRFVSELVRTAKQRVVLFDNYVDDTTLAVLDKRQEGVVAVIYTRKITPALGADLRKHDEQYAPIEVREFSHAHDRFLCIDDIVYHLGASLKDLGRKWFAFSRMEVATERLLEAVGAGGREVAGQ